MGNTRRSSERQSGLSVGAFRHRIQVYRRILAHPGTPLISRALLGLALAYALSPIDLIPDFLPVIGHLDDVLIIPVLIGMALWFVPSAIKEECRQSSGGMDHGKGEEINYGSEME